MNFDTLKIISAGAGSGKTYRLTKEMTEFLAHGSVRPEGIIATTFTKKAASELQERVRVKLLSEGLTAQADALSNALIGTVHGLGVKLLRRFAFEAGVSPQVDILAERMQQQLFNQSLAAALSLDTIEEADDLAERLGFKKKSGNFDFRREVRQLADVARANDFSADVLERCMHKSWQTLKEFLPDAKQLSLADAHARLAKTIEETIHTLENGQDATKVTAMACDKLRDMLRRLRLKETLNWHDWAAIGKLDVGAKSRDDVEDLKAMAWLHEELPGFQADIRRFIDIIFTTAAAAIREFEDYKKRRGLIDYTDMEVLVSRLLDNPQVQAVLREELDLLLVDEFQDTSPIQLDIFLKLSQLARFSIWVGDPKQSIYGFRGAEPRLMEAIINAVGIDEANIQTRSYRSRKDLVNSVNAIFCKAFPHIPARQVALDPVRLCAAGEEPEGMDTALQHWHFVLEDGGRMPGAPWFENSLAAALKQWLAAPPLIQPKGSKQFRHARPGDVAILCRTNDGCNAVANALHRAGLKAALSRTGLLATAEIRLILACLQYLLQNDDSLALAEIQLLAGRKKLEELLNDRLDYLDEYEETPVYLRPTWGKETEAIARLEALRPRLRELSTAETLDIILEELDLRRAVVVWGSPEQRLANMDSLRRMALEYETNCQTTHSAASLGGFLLWLNTMAAENADLQGAAEDMDAVNVVTYHRSKGLEWPVVICYNLEQDLKVSLWGMDLVPEQEQVDLSQVLKGRFLRYWPNPYADQEGRTPLLERLTNSPLFQQKQKQAQEEEARLLYVGLTRARDYLVLPSRHGKPTAWLNRVFCDGDGQAQVLDAQSYEAPWVWQDQLLPKATSLLPQPQSHPASELVLAPVRFMEKARGATHTHQPFAMNAVELLKDGQAPIAIGQQYRYAHALVDKLEEGQEKAAFDALAALLNASVYRTEPDDLAALTKQLVERYQLTNILKTEELLQHLAGWTQWCNQHFPEYGTTLRQTVDFPYQGRYFNAQIDRVLERAGQTVFIQYSSYAGEQLPRPALEKAVLLQAAAVVWEQTSGNPVGRFFVHFPLHGAVVEVVSKAD